MGTRAPVEFWEWLQASGLRELRLAMADVASDEHDPRVFYPHAAGAVELTLAAVLAQVNPLLLYEDRGGFKGRLALARAEPQESWDAVALQIRTANYRDLLARARHIIEDLQQLAEDVLELGEFRNAVVHAGGCPWHRTSDHLVVALKVLRLCYEKSGWDWAAALRNDRAAADRWLNQANEATVNRVRDRISRAQIELTSRYSGTDVDIHDLARSLHTSWLAGNHEHQPVRCPSCAVDAIASGWLNVMTEVEEKDGITWVKAFRAHLNVNSFRCEVCGLRLRGDEVRAADIPSTIDVPMSQEEAERIWREQSDTYSDVYSDDY